jgi:hypothetical protein
MSAKPQMKKEHPKHAHHIEHKKPDEAKAETPGHAKPNVNRQSN